MQKLLPPLTHIYGALLVDWNSTATAVPVLYIHKPSLSSQRSCSHRGLAQGVGCITWCDCNTRVALHGPLLLVAQVTGLLLILFGSVLGIFITSLKHTLLLPIRRARACAYSGQLSPGTCEARSRISALAPLICICLGASTVPFYPV